VALLGTEYDNETAPPLVTEPVEAVRRYVVKAGALPDAAKRWFGAGTGGGLLLAVIFQAAPWETAWDTVDAEIAGGGVGNVGVEASLDECAVLAADSSDDDAAAVSSEQLAFGDSVGIDAAATTAASDSSNGVGSCSFV
jgi:hypothetical protein